MKKSVKTILLVASALAILVAAGFFFLRKETANRIQIQAEAVEYGDLLSTVTATGTIEPVKTVDVGTQVSGIINKIYVDYSSKVKKGQILAELDRSTLQASMVSSKASYESAKNELSYQKSNYDRIKQLLDNQSVSKTDYETALYQYNNAKYAFTNAQSGLEKAQTNLNYATITSPIDGIILSRAVDEGQTVAASFSTPTMFSIAQDLKKMRVIADVDEADIGTVKVGQNVKFTVDAFPEDEFIGKVTMVRLEAQITSNVVTYEVVIDAPNPDEKLLPGLTASVSIYTQERHHILVVPSKALRVQPTSEMLQSINGDTTSTVVQKDPGEKRSVWIKKSNGRIEKRVLEIGMSDGIITEVIGGLARGEQVVTALSSVNTSMEDTTKSSTQTTSPFMPKRPGQTTKK